MLNHLLALFRVDHSASRVEAVDVSEIVSSILKANERRIGDKRIRVIVGSMPKISADAVQLRHVVANLLDNAIKYTGDKPEPTISIECVEEGGGYRITIRDNGIGVPESQRERIFQLYQRGTVQQVGGQVQEGAGIGLAIAKRIVERWGGSVRLESQLGEGAAFSFTIAKEAGVMSDRQGREMHAEVKESSTL
jgi:signal transduction histidine kinase